jgi:hypothetical protein
VKIKEKEILKLKNRNDALERLALELKQEILGLKSKNSTASGKKRSKPKRKAKKDKDLQDKDLEIGIMDGG